MEPPKGPPDPDPDIDKLSDRELVIYLLEKVKNLDSEVKSLKEELAKERNNPSINQKILHFENQARSRTNSTNYNENFPLLPKNNEMNLRPQYQRTNNPSSTPVQAPQVPRGNPSTITAQLGANYPLKVEAMRESAEMVGLGPISITDVVAFYQAGNTSDLHQYSTKEVTEGEKHHLARVLAVKDLLGGELNFEDEEIEITATKFSSDLGKQLVWCRLRNRGMVARIFARNAKIQNRDVKIVQKYPTQAWKRLKELERLIKVERTHNDNMRFQVRIGHDDLQVMWKGKGGVYQPIGIQEFAKGRPLPPLEFFSTVPRGRQGPPPPTSTLKPVHSLTPPSREAKKKKESESNETATDNEESSEEEDNDHENKSDTNPNDRQKDAGEANGGEEPKHVVNQEKNDAKPPPATELRAGGP